jgi:acyl-CoA thioester hydrolase
MTAPLVSGIVVRYYECDPQGRVFNAVYYYWAELGIADLWVAVCGGYDGLTALGLDTTIATNSCQYHAPAHSLDEITLQTAIARVGTTSFDIRTTMRRGEQLVAEVTTTQVFVDKDTMRPIEPPADLKRAIEGFLVA